jgi:ADP-dependent NAD(P)H-hydrate dehydratase / NAD(P)H-hydrate epimerase
VRPVLSPEEAGALDHETQARGISARSLMEAAGTAVARVAIDVAGGVYGRRAVVVCGKGNNGGDGFVAARHLARRGLRVAVIALEDPAELRDEAAANAARLAETDAVLRPFSPATLARELGRADVAVDAIFGTGFRGIPEDEWAGAIDALNDGPSPVVAVDIPSGVNGSTGAVEGEAVSAEVTVTFGAEKRGTVLLPGAERAGLVEVADIGFPKDLVASRVGLVDREDVAATLPTRPVDTHKQASGIVLAIGGSRDMTGAPRLMGSAAYRAGAGLVTVAVPIGILPVVQAGLAEATFAPVPETGGGSVARAALAALADRLETVDAVAIGPGLGRDEQTQAFVRSFVKVCPVPMVIDADALNAFAGRAGELAERAGEAVLTPHTGEFARLSGAKAAQIEADRIGHAEDLARMTGAVVLLKGSRTVIAAPGAGDGGTGPGEVRISAEGTPALATAGSGDVLTGTVAALLAREVEPLQAAAAGAFLHGVAGRLAGRVAGEGTTAEDVCVLLPEARAEILDVRADLPSANDGAADA